MKKFGKHEKYEKMRKKEEIEKMKKRRFNLVIIILF